MPLATVRAGSVHRQLRGGNPEQRAGGGTQQSGIEQHPAAIGLGCTAEDAKALSVVEHLEQADVRRAQTDGENRHDPGLLSSHEVLG
jgi:hypothetical protein